MSIRDDFFANKAVGALWDVAVSIKRGNPLPLDSNSVFASYADLETYAAGVLAYPGQIVAVVNADSTGIYYLDQELAIQEVGKIPSADNKSIEVADGVISMYNFGKYYYKYIPAVKDEETGEVITAADYRKTEVSDTDVWAAGLEPKVVSEDGELVIGWFEPNPTTAEGVQDQVVAIQGTVSDLDDQLNKEGGLVDQVEDLQKEIGHAATEAGNDATGLYAELDKKANAADVYTKSETDTAIATAVNAADHLKRKIVEKYEDIQTYIDGHDDADRYIFMVPTVYVYTSESNKYDEYIVLKSTEEDNTIVYTIEPVGSWAVDLANYVSETELADYLKTYYNQEQVDKLLEAYATTVALESKLEKYYTIEQLSTVLDGYYTDDEIDALLAANIYNKTEIDSKFNDYYTKTEANGLLDDKVSKEDGKSLVSDTEIAKLATVKENAEENYIKSVNDTQFIVSAAGKLDLSATVTNALLTDSDKEKLNALVIGENNKVEVSGTVNASNVQDLDKWVRDHRDSTEGLLSTANAIKLSEIEEGAQVNFIKSVDTADFTVDANGHLILNNSIPFTSLSADFTVNEQKQLTLTNDYVTTTLYQTEVGDLAQLLRVTGNENSTLVDEINYINERLKWGELSE